MDFALARYGFGSVAGAGHLIREFRELAAHYLSGVK